jgi:TetR/AcrR family transcriptional regulator, fatty acid metabolism regulator protein
MTTQERSRTRRQKVLDAALRVFAERGYSETAVDEIARASETSKGGLYFHFPSKQALFLALLDEASDALLGRVEAAMAAEPDPLARGDAALREVLHVFGGHRHLARLLLVEALGAGGEFVVRLNALHAAFAALIAGCLDEAVARGQIPPCDTRVVAHAWYGAVNQTVLRWLLTGEPRRLEETYPTLRSLLLYGVQGRSEEPVP